MRRSLLAATLLSYFALVLLTSLPFWTSVHLQEEGDLAANALQVERAREGQELLGPYSQHGFNHPGPAAFYVQAWTEPLFPFFPSLAARHFAAVAALNLTVVAVVLILLARAGVVPVVVVSGVFLLPAPLLFSAGGSAIKLASVWGPSMVVLPLALAVVATARLMEGDLVALPAAALGALLAGHSHVLTVPALGALGIALAAARAKHPERFTPAPRSRRGRVLVLGAAAIALAGLCPLVLEQISGSPGNLILMLRYLRESAPEFHPWREVVQQLGPVFTDPLVVLMPRLAPVLASPLAILAVVAVFLGGSIWLERRRLSPWRPILRLTWIIIALTVVLARHVNGRLEPHLFHYLHGLVGVLYVAAADAAWERLRRTRFGTHRGAPLAVAAGGTVLLGFWLVGHRLEAPLAQDGAADLARAFDLAAGAAVHLELGGGADDGSLWPQIPTHALRLRRAGHRVTVAGRFAVMCGREMRPERRDAAGATLVFSREEPATPGLPTIIHDGWRVTLHGPVPDAAPDGPR